MCHVRRDPLLLPRSFCRFFCLCFFPCLLHYIPRFAMNSIRSQVFRGQRQRPWRSVVSSSQIRKFHQTRPTRGINDILDVSAGFIHGVHSISHLPWVASIPLTALIVRTCLGLPLHIYTKINARREREIAPLMASWVNHIMMKGQSKGWSKREISKEIRFRHTDLRRRANVSSLSRFAGLIQIPVWISLMESVRGMCGNKNGLVPWLLSMMSSESDGAEHLHLTVEPTLANEGALWFPDLLAGDPTGALPLLLSASIVLNIRNGWHVASRKELADMPKMQMLQHGFWAGLRVFMQVLALNVGASTYFYEMPTALMIYWITSTNVATLQTWFLDKYMFAKPPLPSWSRRYTHYQSPTLSDPYRQKLL